jgi:hypothetical protein
MIGFDDSERQAAVAVVISSFNPDTRMAPCQPGFQLTGLIFYEQVCVAVVANVSGAFLRFAFALGADGPRDWV